MAELRTEEEQVEAIKRWWQENGKSLVISIALALTVVLGWRAWQSNQETYAANASSLYENLSSVVESGIALDDETRTSLQFIGEQLKTEYGSSAYAPMASMILARIAVESNDLERALAELDYVGSSDEASGSMKSLAQLRKSRVYLALDRLDEASQALTSVSGTEYGVLVSELQGDLAYRRGDLDAARAFYEEAMEAADPQTASLIKLKRDDLNSGASS